jgi:filamentous hemagglutinin family protein
MQRADGFRFLTVVLAGALWSLGCPALAQVRADHTLNTSVRSEGNTFVIEGGRTSNNQRNLFHSFDRFSVPGNDTASFRVDSAVSNVFARVTGSFRSRIDGRVEVLQANGIISPANLFLLNPRGIIFGQNASLNVGGSFLATTGDRFIFDNEAAFRADGTQSDSLLTVNVPVGLQFGQNPGFIRNESVANVTDNDGIPIAGGLQVPPGRTIALIGGDIDFAVGSNADLLGGTMIAAGGRIELGSVGAFSQVDLTVAEGGFKLGYDDVQNFQDISLLQAALNTSGLRNVPENRNASGGSIQLRGRLITLTQGSLVISNTLGRLNGRNISIQADRLGVNKGSQITTLTQEAGEGGDIFITANHLVVQRAGQIAALTDGSGNGGSLAIVANTVDVIDFRHPPQIDDPETSEIERVPLTNLATQARESATGNGGTLRIDTDELQVRNGAQIIASTFGQGNAGTLRIRAEAIDLFGTASDQNGRVLLQGGLPVASGLYASAELDLDPNVSGNAGNVVLNVNRLHLQDGAIIKTATEGSGNAGNLIIRGFNQPAADQIEVMGTDVENRLPTGIVAFSGGIVGLNYGNAENATGFGGNIEMNTRALRVIDGAAIAVGSLNPNDNASGGGQLTINAQTVQLDQQAQLTAASASANGGNINLDVQDLLLLQRNSNVSASAEKGGDGGNITLNAADGFLVTVPNEDSDIVANAFTGQGGNITLTTQGNFGIEVRRSLQDNGTNDISASSARGVAGTITLNTPNVDPIRRTTVLPSAAAVPVLAQGCQVSGGQSTAEFFNTGRGGLPPTPYESISSNDILDDVRLPSPETAPPERTTSLSESTDPSDQAIVEAGAWIMNKQGQVVLVAEAPSQFRRCQLR